MERASRVCGSSLDPTLILTLTPTPQPHNPNPPTPILTRRVAAACWRRRVRPVDMAAAGAVQALHRQAIERARLLPPRYDARARARRFCHPGMMLGRWPDVGLGLRPEPQGGPNLYPLTLTLIITLTLTLIRYLAPGAKRPRTGTGRRLRRHGGHHAVDELVPSADARYDDDAPLQP